MKKEFFSDRLKTGAAGPKLTHLAAAGGRNFYLAIAHNVIFLYRIGSKDPTTHTINTPTKQTQTLFTPYFSARKHPPTLKCEGSGVAVVERRFGLAAIM